MTGFLIKLLFPGTPAVPGGNPVTLGHEGIAWTTAGGLFVLLAIAVGYGYLGFARKTSRFARFGLTALRLLLIAVLLLLLVRPILVIPKQETNRRPLLVLLDTSRSMTLTDRRESAADQARAALAAGLIDPAGGLDQALPSNPPQPARSELLTALAANPRLALWPRLHANADLHFHGFGGKLADLGPLIPADSEAFFRNAVYQDDATALGDALRNLLAKTRDPVAGVLVISDGANNAGASPVEVAREALADDIPLFIYGVGVSSPPDIAVTELIAPATTAMKERVDIVVHFRSQGLVGMSSTLRLTAGDQVVAEERVDFRSDGGQEKRFSFIPEAVGNLELTATVLPLPQEAIKANNVRSTGLRVRDERLDVLIVQREPNWDFQYLLAFLQRDRRTRVTCALLRGDPDLAKPRDSPFLAALPSDRAGLLNHDIIILGDVAPADLGPARLTLLHEWVSRLGGGLVLLSGPNLNATAYRGTPLEPLWPVTPGSVVPAGSANDRIPLSLTAAGEASPLLRLAADQSASNAIWAAFPGVRWVTPSGPARAGAQVLLTGPAGGSPPVALAIQPYGAGQALYVGFGETHLWRARAGEKHYARIWLQLLDGISAGRDSAASPFSQLKIERAEYFPGERLRLTARALNADFTPLAASELIANISLQTAGAAPVTLRLAALPGRPGEFSGELPAPAEEAYTASLAADPAAHVPFRVRPSAVELGDISLRERTLRAMAAAANGHFLREEDLAGLPERIAAKNVPLITYQKVPLTLAPGLLALMILAACGEWFWRRKIDLK